MYILRNGPQFNPRVGNLSGRPGFCGEGHQPQGRRSPFDYSQHAPQLPGLHRAGAGADYGPPLRGGRGDGPTGGCGPERLPPYPEPGPRLRPGDCPPAHASAGRPGLGCNGLG
ncbi:hypothetical protein GBAR_LOCUS6911 [Geodia barretti]|uniref:Uncharacterized protein n=1 Tax=Geodia barretti TaxID=519541 RepID=A0AA35RFE1_GEOBA|nr:hypothetical protein GBAR_LOCUS6911 [Geodia barretti]